MNVEQLLIQARYNLTPLLCSPVYHRNGYNVGVLAPDYFEVSTIGMFFTQMLLTPFINIIYCHLKKQLYTKNCKKAL